MKTVELNDSELSIIETVEKETGHDRATVVKELLRLGFSAWKRKHALDLYRNGKITLNQAARSIGISVYEMLEELRKENISILLNTEDLREVVYLAALRKMEFYKQLEQLGKE
jgi:predicted HTH domain antitoxin